MVQNIQMERYNNLAEQHEQAQVKYQEAMEIEKLSREHAAINRVLSEMAKSIMENDATSPKDQDDFNDLARKQEEIFNQIKNKILR